MHDLDQLVHRSAELFTKANQTIPFLRRKGNPSRQLVAQDPVLNLQVTDMSSQFLVRRCGKYEQKPSIDVVHRGNFIKCKQVNRLASFLHTADTPTTWTDYHFRRSFPMGNKRRLPECSLTSV